MYYKWVTLRYRHYSVLVFVPCTPDTPRNELKQLARGILRKAENPTIQVRLNKERDSHPMQEALTALKSAEERFVSLEKQGRIQNGATLEQIRKAIDGLAK